nr:MAG TPA: Protein of unknown function (DUF3990) [Caudoviricetes sp.]
MHGNKTNPDFGQGFFFTKRTESYIMFLFQKYTFS